MIISLETKNSVLAEQVTILDPDEQYSRLISISCENAHLRQEIKAKEFVVK